MLDWADGIVGLWKCAVGLEQGAIVVGETD